MELMKRWIIQNEILLQHNTNNMYGRQRTIQIGFAVNHFYVFVIPMETFGEHNIFSIKCTYTISEKDFHHDLTSLYLMTQIVFLFKANQTTTILL